MELTVSAAGSLTPQAVWDRYVHPARWSQWSPQIPRVDCADETLRPGSRGRVHGPPGFAVDFIVEVLDPAEQRWSWRARVLLVGVRLHLEHGVHDDRIGVRTWLRIRGPAWVVLAYAPVAQWSLTRLVDPERRRSSPTSSAYSATTSVAVQSLPAGHQGASARIPPPPDRTQP